jgi:hypothetical protein
MKDSKKKSLLETIVDIIIGYVISTGLNFIILPFYATEISNSDFVGMMQIGVWYMIVAIIRKYIFRRLFERFRR